MSPNDTTECKRKSLRTAEPGTCLHRDAYRVLKAIEKIKDNPLENKKEKKFFDLMEPRVHRVIDTIIRTGSLTVPLRIYYPDKKSLSEIYPIIFITPGGRIESGPSICSDLYGTM